MKPVKPGTVKIFHASSGVLVRFFVMVVLWFILGIVCTLEYQRLSYLYDPRIERLCTSPTEEGAMTVHTIIKGQHVCWRWVS